MNTPETAPVPNAKRNHAARRKRRWLPWLGAVVLAAAITAGLWPQPAPVETARVANGRMRITVDEEGKTRIRQRYTVSAPVSGELRRITLDPGDAIQVGQSVAVIDALRPALLDARSRQLAEARRDAAQENLERARAAQHYATNELQRFEKLNAEKAVSIQEFEVVKWRAEAAAREQNAARSALAEAEAALAEFAGNATPAAPARVPTEVTSPAAGRVLRVFDDSARVVNAGQPLMEIGDPADLEVVIEVLSRDGAAIAPGTVVELDQWGGGAPLQAKVRLVEPAAFTKVSALGVEEQRVRVIADILTPPAQRPSLGDQFRVESRIVKWETDNTLKVPSGALFRRGDQWAAFVVENGRAILRTVQIGRATGRETQVLNGLQAGEVVILHPGDRVRESQRIKPVTL